MRDFLYEKIKAEHWKERALIADARIEALEAALRGLVDAVRIDSDEGGKGISGNTGARLSDARAALENQ